jgi:site-specific recombinase XerD
VQWLEARGQAWEAATGAEVKGFLSELATRQRASASTQKQALNALVFLGREALGRPVGDLGGFVRGRQNRRVPVVLTRGECQRLFAALDGTPRLMAELMYGSGLRLMELLALRISNAIAIGMLFMTGWVFGRITGRRPWVMGLAMVALGAVLVGLTMALGG